MIARFLRPVAFVATIFGIASIGVAQTPVDSAESGPVGRYQFIVANISAGGEPGQKLFKIDTTTGRAWQFISLEIGIPENKRFSPQVKSVSAEGWMSISESYLAEYQKQIDAISKMPTRNETPKQEKKP